MRARSRVADEVVLDDRVELAAVRRAIVHLRSANGLPTIYVSATHFRAMCSLFWTVDADRITRLETGVTHTR